MRAIRIADYRELIERVASKVATRPVEIYLPHDPRIWCEERGLSAQQVTYATAVKNTSTGAWGIVFSPEISEQSINSIVSGMEIRGFGEARTLREDPEQFVAHLVLHELAHLENNWGQEMESACDEWAFEMLPLAL